MGFFRKTWDASALRRRAADGTYWLRIVLLIVLGMALAQVLAGFDWWRAATYSTYGTLLRLSQSPLKYPSRTAVVIIDDDDFWHGEWARRSPIKRATLARLIRQIETASPLVIAIDIDLRAQTPDGSFLTHPDYEGETNELLGAITQVAQRIPVVLPKTIGFDTAAQQFVVDADVFDHKPLGPNVAAGYTMIPSDLRNLALPTHVDGHPVSSLAAAAASFVDPESVVVAQERGHRSLPYSMFLGREAYDKKTVCARDVLAGQPRALATLKNRVVVVGGRWHRDAYGRGELIDQHLTPVGMLSGVLVHANYIEALLTQRTFSPSYHWVHYAADALVGISLAAIFIAVRSKWKVLYLIVLAVIVALSSVVAFQNLGTIFDGVPVVVLLGAHAAYETILEWKRGHDAWKRGDRGDNAQKYYPSASGGTGAETPA